jgi:hypothetical protein
MLGILFGYLLFTLYLVLGGTTFIALSGVYQLEPVNLNIDDKTAVVNNLLAIVGVVFLSIIWPVYLGYHAVVKVLPRMLRWFDDFL